MARLIKVYVIPKDATLAYRRDASFYDFPGWGSQYHFCRPSDPALSRCSRRIVLVDFAGLRPAEVPALLRCQRRGCRERWPVGE